MMVPSFLLPEDSVACRAGVESSNGRLVEEEAGLELSAIISEGVGDRGSGSGSTGSGPGEGGGASTTGGGESGRMKWPRLESEGASDSVAGVWSGRSTEALEETGFSPDAGGSGLRLEMGP